MDSSQRVEFLKTEYQEASKAYSLGVQVGQDVLKAYLSGTTVLVALFGGAAGLIKEKVLFAQYAIFAIPMVGIVASFLAIILLDHYNKHLDGCCNRCVEIEREFGGRIFTNIQRVSSAAKFDGVKGFKVISALFMLMWAYFLLIIENF
ncbi:hypothetical protein [Bradyrhizobium aeschynomenes]|uniref:hypothetical protein n=1 Tax=Bradyrhizobium aeschynomenes TaxID=2734909 RepID=UPI001552FD12|nr:hypothetical protein [Bradyrhizobium aeschynomenes]NPV20715.1 hypothetical protein [Bradyrhizobium aeschynomenes]